MKVIARKTSGIYRSTYVNRHTAFTASMRQRGPTFRTQATQEKEKEKEERGREREREREENEEKSATTQH